MTFLAPVNLILLGLLAVVVLAYLLRMPRRRLRVPDAQVARLALPEAARLNRQRRTLISLAIQGAIVLLLATAAAVPFLGDASGSGRSLIVLLDVSASMRACDDTVLRVLNENEESPAVGAARSRFARAIEAVRGLARDIGPHDRMMLIAVGRTTDVVTNFQSDPDVLQRALSSLSARAESADFAGACRLAAAIQQPLPDGQVVLVTDGALDPADLAPLRALDVDRVKLVLVGNPSGNMGITGFHVRRNLDSPTDYEALVSVVNTDSQPRKTDIELMLNDTVFDLATVTVAGKGRATQVFHEKLRVGGVLSARLRVVDALADDNLAREVLIEPRRLRVLLVSDHTDPASFLVRAVGSNAGSVEGMVITPEQYRKLIAPNPEALRDQRDAVVFDRWVPDKPEELPPTDILSINRVPPGIPASEDGSLDKPLIRKWDEGHPLMAYVNLRNVFINTAQKVAVLDPQAGQPPLERVAEMVTSPLVLAWERPMPATDQPANPEQRARRTRPQRFVVLAFDPQQSDIVLRKELPLLVWNSFSWFQKQAEPVTQALPGTTIVLDERLTTQTESVTVTAPDRTPYVVPVEAESGRALFGATSLPGVYTWKAAKGEGSFVVNIDPAESNITPSTDLGFAAETLSADKLAQLHKRGQPLWPYLLAVAACLVTFEAIVFHRRIYF